MVDKQDRKSKNREHHRKGKRDERGSLTGAVLSPLLFITFLDYMLVKFEDNTMVSAYADDLALAVVSRTWRIECRGRWREQNGLNLNIGKCETCLFTPSTAEFKWTPKLTVADQTIKDTQYPSFLGISYDKLLTFSHHTEEEIEDVPSPQGWESRESMRMVYTAMQRIVADYGSVAWAPWIFATNMEKIERAQRRAVCRITGASQSMPNEALSREAGLEDMKTRY